MARNSAAAVIIGSSAALFAIAAVRFLEPAIRAVVGNVLETILKILKAYFDVALGYIKGTFFYFYSKFFSIRPVAGPVTFLGLSLIEIIVAIFSIILLGLTFAYSKPPGLTMETFTQWLVASGLTVVICDFARRSIARRYNALAEFKFWEVGTFTLLLTAFALRYPFSQPGKTIVEEKSDSGAKIHGIISLVGPSTALLLSILFLFMKFISSMPELIGDTGVFIGSVADKGVWVSMICCVYGLLPFEPMAGRGVFKWSKTVWLLVFIPAVLLFFLVSILFQPVPSPDDFIPAISNFIFGK
jgi:hypothetical protein